MAGVVAGYVNGKIENVSINVSKELSPSSITINKGNSSLSLDTKSFPSTSEFTSIGYCEEEYKAIQYRSENQVYSPITGEGKTFTAGGKENEWGGSLDMSAFTKRLNNLSSNYAVSQEPKEYSLEETTNLDSLGKAYDTTKVTFSSYYTNSVADFTGYQYYDGTTKTGVTYDSLVGSINMVKSYGNNNSYVYYLNAGTKISTGFFKNSSSSTSQIRSVSFNGHYLAISDNEQLTSVSENKFAWRIPIATGTDSTATGTIYAQLNNKTYYLTISENQLSLTTNSSAATTWTVGPDSESGSKYKISYDNYYIDFNDTTQQFMLTEDTAIKSEPFKIMAINTATSSSGSSENRIYYLALDKSSLSNGKYYFDRQVYDVAGTTANEIKALEWHFGDSVQLSYSNKNYTCRSIYTNINGTDYYLECQTNADKNKEFYLTSSLNTTNQKTNHFIIDETTGYVQIIQNNLIRALRHIKPDASDAEWGWCYSSDVTGQDDKSEYAIGYNGNPADFIGKKYKKYMFTLSTPDISVQSYYYKYDREDVSYLPINVDDNYQASSNNTGYLVGGTKEVADNNPYGNVRISDYGISKQSNLTDYEGVKNGSKLPLTVTLDYKIDENLDPNSFRKYKTAFSAFKSSILKDEESNNLYGLHFMNANISKNKLVTAKIARISEKNGTNEYKDYTNYQLPANSLDFHLQAKGYINFFAGTYGYTTSRDNDSFFSLHEIIRDSSNESKIEEIREIKTIYKTSQASSNGYLYEYVNSDSASSDRLFSAKFTYDKDANRVYSDGQSRSSLIKTTQDNSADYLKGYTAVFDTEQLGNRNSEVRSKIKTSYTQRTFYFEIPVNDGEYALGSVDGGTGAYLMYLDIGSNATTINRTTITEKFTQTKFSLAYPNGVQFTIDDKTKNNFCVSIPATYKGKLSINDDNSEYRLDLTTDSSAEEKPIIGYYDDGTTFSSSNTLAFSKGSQVGSTSITTRETFIDYNTNDGSTTKIIITDDGTEKTGEYYLNGEKVDKDKVNIYVQSGTDWVIEDDISKIDFQYEGSDIIIFTFSFETKEEDTIKISYVLSIKEIESDGTVRYFTDDGYTISFTLNDKEVTIKLTKPTGTSTSYTVDLTNGEGIRHQP